MSGTDSEATTIQGAGSDSDDTLPSQEDLDTLEEAIKTLEEVIKLVDSFLNGDPTKSQAELKIEELDGHLGDLETLKEETHDNIQKFDVPGGELSAGNSALKIAFVTQYQAIETIITLVECKKTECETKLEIMEESETSPEETD